MCVVRSIDFVWLWQAVEVTDRQYKLLTGSITYWHTKRVLALLSNCIKKFRHTTFCNIRACQIWCNFDRASSLICGNKCQLDATEIIIADLTACSTYFGHHYAYHQELKSIIQWLLRVVFCAVVYKLLVWCGAEGYVSGLQDAPASPNTTGSNHCIILLSSWWWA